MSIADKKNTISKAKKNYQANDAVTFVNEVAVAYETMSTKPLSVAHRSLELLGIGSVKQAPVINNESDFIPMIREGIRKQSMQNLMEVTGITAIEMSVLVRTSDRTLRRYTAQQKLNPEQSERLIELARLYSRGEEVFGSLDSFKEWMDSTVMALGNKKPKTFLDTSLGIDMLINELGRIEYGIFA